MFNYIYLFIFILLFMKDIDSILLCLCYKNCHNNLSGPIFGNNKFHMHNELKMILFCLGNAIQVYLLTCTTGVMT